MDIRFLMDVPAPNPAAPVVGSTGVTVLILVALALAATMIAGFVYLLIRIKRRRRMTNEVAASERASNE